MKIFLAGYFFVGALCDDLLRYCTENIIKKIDQDIEILHRNSDIVKCCRGDVIDFINFLNKEVDMVVFCGGSLLGKLRLYPFNQIKHWNKHLKIPLVIFGTGWREESLNNEDINNMKLLLELAKYVGVRGEITKKELLKIYNKKDVEVIGDPIFSFPKYKIDNNSLKSFCDSLSSQRIGSNVRGILEIEREQFPDTISNEEFFDSLAEILDFISLEKNKQIVFLPMTTTQYHGIKDQEAIEKVREKMKTKKHITRYLNLDIMAASLGEMDLVIGQRLHVNMVSLAQGVPIIPLDYQFNKMRDCLSATDKFEDYYNLILSGKEFNLITVKKLLEKILVIPKNKILSGVGELKSRQYNFMEKIINEYSSNNSNSK